MRVAATFADLDGTWLATDKSLPAGNVRALDRLQAAGGTFVPCTGRNASMLPVEVIAHPSCRLAIAANGAAAYEVLHDGVETRLGQRLFSVPMGAERALALYERLHDLDVTFDLFVGEEVYVERWRFAKILGFGIEPHMLAYLQAGRTQLDLTVPQILEEVCVDGGEPLMRITMFWDDPADRDRILEVVREDPSLVIVSSWKGGFEISDARATKGNALVWACDYLGVDLRDVVAFGDSGNDASMLSAAGMGVAMGNGTDEARAAADCVCGTNDEGGAGLFLEGLLAK